MPIEHIYVEQTTRQTHTGDANYTDITGVQISGATLSSGDSYFIAATASIDGTDINGNFGVRLVRASTEFPGSEQVWEPDENANARLPYLFWDVWTAGSNETIKLQYKTVDLNHTVGADDVTLFAMNLTDNLTKDTDWHYSAAAASTNLNDTWSTSNNAQIAFTPAASDWLVMTRSRIDPNSATRNWESRMSSVGDVGSAQPELSYEGEDTALDRTVLSLIRVFPLTASVNTFTEESRIDVGTNKPERTHSAVFALDLGKFSNHSYMWSEAEVALSTTDFATEVGTVGITPASQSTVWAMGHWAWDVSVSDEWVHGRIQLDNSDSPAGQTASKYSHTAWDATDELPLYFQTVEDLSSSIHSFDLDASTSDSGNTAEDISLFAVTMLLSGEGVGPTTSYATLSDTFTFTGNPVRDFWGDRSQADSFTLSENLDPLRHLLRIQDDSSTFADSLVPQTFLLRLLSDSATFSDNQLRDFVGTRTLDDSIALTESLARDLVADRALQEALSFSEQHLVERWLDRLAQESIVLSEQIARDGIFTRDLQEVITFAENLDNTTTGGNQTVSKTLQDVFTFIDNLLTGKTTNRSTSDAFTFVDQTLRTAVFTRSATDSATFADSPLTDLVLDRQLQDSLTLAENLAWNTARLRQIADEFNLTEQVVRDLILDRVLTDTLTLTENFVVTGAEAPAAAAEHWRLFTHHKWALRRRLWRRYMDLDIYPPQ